MANIPSSTIHWLTRFHMFSTLPGLPLPISAGHETQCSTKYRHAGTDRSGDHHCVFKYTLRGEGAISLGGREYRTPAGTGFVCLVSDPDVVYFYPPDRTDPWEFVWLAFAGDTAFRMIAEIVNRWGPVFQLPAWHDVVTNLLDLGRYENGSAELLLSEGARLVSDVLLTLLHSQETAQPSNPDDIIVRNAVRLLETDVTLNVNALAQQLDLSREHLTRVFRRTLDMTPHQYIGRQRMLHACHLLKTTSLKISHIAAACGYDDLASFTRFFRQSQKTTPAQFRRNGVLPLF